MVCRIYALISGQLVLYVGKTTQTLTQRMSEHRSKSNKTWSRYIPEYTDWVITLLEECTEKNGTERERHYYNILKPLYNRCTPGRTDREYKVDNRERGMGYIRKWRAKNRQYTSEYERKRYAKKKLAASVSSDTHIVSDTPISPS